MDQPQGNISRVIERSPWWAPWLVLLLTLAGFFFNSYQANQIAERNAEARNLIREASIDSCERVNVLREQFNERSDVLREFMLAAANARRATGDDQTALLYEKLSEGLDTVPLTECVEAFPEGISRASFTGLPEQ